MSIPITPQNFVRAETNRMLRDLTALSGGVGIWYHTLAPTPLDMQKVIRMNRDTLYSSVIVDLAQGATITIPEYRDRYVSVMVVNQDHYINRIFHEPGTYELTIDEFDTRYVAVAARVLANSEDPADVAAANDIQRGLAVDAGSNEPFEMPDYDEASFTEVREAVLALARHAGLGHGTFGRKDEVDVIRHLCGAAAGWGGLPSSEAVYQSVDDGLPVGEYRIDVGDVPVDAFWSISVYNHAGFFEPNPRNSYSVNSLTADRNPDGTITVHLGGDDDRPNLIPLPEGWNYTVRLYRPHPEVQSGEWTFPAAVPISR